MADLKNLQTEISARFSAWIIDSKIALGELTVEVKPEYIVDLCNVLKTDTFFDFNQLIDLCGVDYLRYGLDDWQTQVTTEIGFSRGVTAEAIRENPPKPHRFAVVYHLLSLNQNHRIRLRVFLADENNLMIDSLINIWPSANWYEREVFDLFGILFCGHPDLRRILTDYGFIGHPFRKDFPLIGKVEPRYDASLGRIVYEPVSITNRVLEPKVIRHDHRYKAQLEELPKDGK